MLKKLVNKSREVEENKKRYRTIVKTQNSKEKSHFINDKKKKQKFL